MSCDDTNLPILNIETPTVTDVLFGRGKSVDNHPGNKALQNLIKKHKGRYANCDFNIEKKAICISIVKTIREKKGRFLKLNSSGTYDDFGDKEAIKKVSQALREKHKAKQIADESTPGTQKTHKHPVKSRKAINCGDSIKYGMEVGAPCKPGVSPPISSRTSAFSAGSAMVIKLTPSDMCPTVTGQGGSRIAEALGLGSETSSGIFAKCYDTSDLGEDSEMGESVRKATSAQSVKNDTPSAMLSSASSLSNNTALSRPLDYSSSLKIGSSASGTMDVDP